MFVRHLDVKTAYLYGSLQEEVYIYDWAGDTESRRSTSGILFKFGGGCIMWASHRQSCVTLSSMEAEYVALGEACHEALWLRQLLRDLGELTDQPTTIMEYNQGCLAFVRSERVSRKSKHIDTKECFVREAVGKCVCNTVQLLSTGTLRAPTK